MEIQLNVRVMVVHGDMVLCGIANQVLVVREREMGRSSEKVDASSALVDMRDLRVVR